MRFLFPCEPFRPRQVDPTFAEQFQTAAALGHLVSVLDEEALDQGELRLHPWPEPGESLLWRGWMYSIPRYQTLYRLLHDNGYHPLTDPDNYRQCHWLTGWYPLVECTAQSEFFENLTQAQTALATLNWGAYFVKDFVKSTNLGRLPIVTNAEQLAQLVEKMVEYRGDLEGGLCLRQVEDFQTDSEHRIFVYQGRPHLDPGLTLHDKEKAEITAILSSFVDSISSPFFSVDVAKIQNGPYRVVELGDGQVSDLKHWRPEDLYRIFEDPGKFYV